MLEQKQRLENYIANANQVEAEAWTSAERQAIEMLRKGFCDKFIRNKCLISLKRIQELRERFI